MTLMISSEISKQYLQEEDAIQGFLTAVENGQVRLSLQILADIITAFAEIFELALEDDEEESITEEKPSIEIQPIENNTAVEPNVLEEEPKKKSPSKKAADTTSAES